MLIPLWSAGGSVVTTDACDVVSWDASGKRSIAGWLIGIDGTVPYWDSDASLRWVVSCGTLSLLVSELAVGRDAGNGSNCCSRRLLRGVSDVPLGSMVAGRYGEAIYVCRFIN